MIKMAQIENIRKMYFMEGLSIREISKRTGHHRDTLSKYLSKDNPQPPKYVLKNQRKHPVLEDYIPMIDQILKEDKKRHRKQQHTGQKIFRTLQQLYNYPGGYTTVTDYLRKVRKRNREAFLPLEFELGTYGEVDWTEAYFFLNGKTTKAHLFIMKLRGSGGFYTIAYPFEKQEAFFDGHIKCFEFMGGVPYKLSYDNLKTAVKKVLTGSNREEQEQFIALRTHYLFESTFCQPAKGNEKGGVENAAKDAVRQIFVPYPEVSSFEELNQYLHVECTKMLSKNTKWEAEKAALRQLSVTRFNAARYKEAKISRYAMVHFETNRYSVPTAYVGDKVTVKATADEICIIVKNEVVAVHTRLCGRNKESIVLDHYLELLLSKTRALENTKVYKPTTMPQVYEQFRRILVGRNPKGNREFVRILMLHREYKQEQVMEAIEMAMSFNLYSYDAVLNILLQFNTTSHKVVPLSKDRLCNIPEVYVMPPNVDRYGALMKGGI